MKEFYNNLHLKLETEIDQLELSVNCSIKSSELIILLIVKYLAEVKEHVLKTGFNSVDVQLMMIILKI